ncbi:hypothetical protein IAD21_04229 [Abditibacteriota bacterium]|nr:hypothetical protein IAD21_04229 [Abditibacteriota bacterium]
MKPNSQVFAKAAFAVFQKDLLAEWRSRATLGAVALFSLAAPITLGFSLAQQKLTPEAQGALLWSVLFFAACIGLPRAFVKEEESGTSALLRLHFGSDAVFWGKAAGQMALLMVTQLAAIPTFILLLGARVGNVPLLLAVTVGGDLGLALSSTLIGAMAAQARGRGALFPALAAPILLPFLATLGVATGAAFGARVDSTNALMVVAAFDLALVGAGVLGFELVWK